MWFMFTTDLSPSDHFSGSKSIPVNTALASSLMALASFVRTITAVITICEITPINSDMETLDPGRKLIGAELSLGPPSPAFDPLHHHVRVRVQAAVEHRDLVEGPIRAEIGLLPTQISHCAGAQQELN